MKKITLFTVVLVIFVLFLLSCNKPSPVSALPTATPILANTPNITATAQVQNNVTNTPTPAIYPCTPGNESFSSLSYPSSLTWGGNYIIKSQTAYLANYAGFAPAGSPTPTPVSVDFNAKMVIGISIMGACYEPVWSLNNITTDCNTVNLNVLNTYSPTYCSGGPWCNAIAEIIDYFVVNKTNLPIELQNSVISCSATTTTSSAAFNATVLQ